MNRQQRRALERMKLKASTRAHPVNLNRVKSLIVAQVPIRTLTNELTIALAYQGAVHKLAKLAFTPMSADFYLMLPYLAIDEYRCGRQRVNRGVINTDRAVARTRVPVKLSYHESGQVHLKGQSAEFERSRLARIQARPIAALAGEHIFTIELEGVEHFARANDRQLGRPSTIAIELKDEVKRVELIGYAGRSEVEVLAKYGVGTRPTFSVTFKRETLPAPLVLGVYMFTGESLQPEAPRHPFELLLGGFVPDGSHVDLLYIHGETSHIVLA